MPRRQPLVLRLPAKDTAVSVDAGFTARYVQVGITKILARRRAGTGLFNGHPARFLAYEVFYAPNQTESTFGTFIENIGKLARAVGGSLRLDEVVVVS